MGSKRTARITKQAGALGLLLAAVLIATQFAPVQALPVLPERFRGHVTISGAPAPEGTIVAAHIAGVIYESGTVDAAGRYGYDDADLFYVPADDPDTPEKEGGVANETISFYVGDTLATTEPFESGAMVDLDLAVGQLVAETSLNDEQDLDDVVVTPVRVLRVKDASTGATVPGIVVECYNACILFKRLKGHKFGLDRNIAYDTLLVKFLDLFRGIAVCLDPQAHPPPG